jgi:hypothetical protein
MRWKLLQALAVSLLLALLWAATGTAQTGAQPPTKNYGPKVDKELAKLADAA